MITNLAKKKKRGFTLVEVIIVLAIIAIIAAIAIPNLTQVRQDSKKKADIQTCETIKRVVTTLIVDETMKYSTGGNNTIEINYLTGSAVVTLGTGISNITSNDLQTKYFNTIKKPQQDDGIKYSIVIANDGTVSSVQAQKADGTSLTS